jgi:hypothetical protein
MAGSIVDDLFDRLTQAFPPQRSYGPGDIAAEPMPPPIAHFLDQLLQRRLDLEMRNMREATSAWVDADHPDVHAAARTFRSALRPHLRIPASEWERVLRRAVQRVTAYLIHPTQTMTQFAFGDEDDERPVATLRDRIRFFAPYPYLREAIETLIDQEQATELRRSQFETALRRVDERTTVNYDSDDWMRLLDPLFNLMELTSVHGIPVSFLQTFFQEKRARAIVRRLQTASLEHGTMALDRTDLRRLLRADEEPSGDTAPMTDAPDHAPHAASDPGMAPPIKSTPPAQSEPASPEPSGETSNGPTPLWKQFRNAGGLSSEPPAQAPEPANDVPNDAPLWQRFRPAGSSSTASSADHASSNTVAAAVAAGSGAGSSQTQTSTDKLASLERAVMADRGPSNRALFIRELFGGSQSDYRQTLERLHEAPNWTRASQIIAQDVFRTHQVNIYSKPAVLFTNAVEDRFRQRS